LQSGLESDGQAVCGTPQDPLRAAASRPWLGSRAGVAQDPTITFQTGLTAQMKPG